MNNWEQWQDIPGYEGLYQASDSGKIRSIPRTHSKGGLKSVREVMKYPTVTLSKSSRMKNYRVHTLIAMTFLGARPQDHDVDHINGNRFDNRACNLRYLPHRENSAQAPRALVGKKHVDHHLTENERNELINLFNTGVIPNKYALARKYQVSILTVRRILMNTDTAHDTAPHGETR